MQIVLAVHDQDLRLAIELYLDKEPGLFLAGVATEAESLCALVRIAKPDLLVMSWDLPGCSPAHLIRETRGKPGAPQVIVFGNDASLRPEALAAGAFAVVISSDPAPDFIEVIRQCCPDPTARYQGQVRDAARGVKP